LLTLSSRQQVYIILLFSFREADINWEGPDDKSPLHVAATAGNRAVTQLLLGYGANVRAKDNNLYVFVIHFNTFGS